jgi:hypothetical protein
MNPTKALGRVPFSALSSSSGSTDGDEGDDLACAGLEREMALGSRFLHASSLEAVRGCYERAAVAAHLPALHATTDALLASAADDDQVLPPGTESAVAPARINGRDKITELSLSFLPKSILS